MGQIPAHIQYQAYSRATLRRRRPIPTSSLVSIGGLIGLASFALALLAGLLH